MIKCKSLSKLFEAYGLAREGRRLSTLQPLSKVRRGVMRMTPGSRQGTPEEDECEQQQAPTFVNREPSPRHAPPPPSPPPPARRKYDLATLLNSPIPQHAALPPPPTGSTQLPPWEQQDQQASSLSALNKNSDKMGAFDQGGLELFGSQDGWAALSMLGSTTDLVWWMDN
jgi:hypothetical protein